jgi:TolB protein
MSTRRILMALVALLSLAVVVGGAGVAGLAYYRLATLPGGPDLLVLDADRRLRLLAEDGKERLLAEDLSDDMFRYPAAAPDGERIAYISEDAEGLALTSLHLRTGERTELYRSQADPPLYAIWSPDSSTISFLSNRGEGGLGVHTVAADGATASALLGTTPGSSYFAWQPEGGSLLLHIGGSSFENGRVAVYERGSSEPSHELADPGFFQTPAWSVDGAAFFYVAQPPVSGEMTADQVESVLTRVAADGSDPQALASEKMAAIIFSRAPASDDIAYITIGPQGLGDLKVVDAGGGAARTLSRPDEAIPAFFWSPDGSQLAYLTVAPGGGGGPPRLTWHVVAREGGAVRDLASFTPSQAFAGMISFFDAYALALDLWSPDGSQIVYGTDEGVYVVDVASGEATRRADGVLAMWAK